MTREFPGQTRCHTLPAGRGIAPLGHVTRHGGHSRGAGGLGKRLRVIAKERASRSLWANNAIRALRTEGPTCSRSAGRWRRPAGAEVLSRVQFDITPPVA